MAGTSAEMRAAAASSGGTTSRRIDSSDVRLAWADTLTAATVRPARSRIGAATARRPSSSSWSTSDQPCARTRASSPSCYHPLTLSRRAPSSRSTTLKTSSPTYRSPSLSWRGSSPINGRRVASRTAGTSAAAETAGDQRPGAGAGFDPSLRLCRFWSLY